MPAAAAAPCLVFRVGESLYGLPIAVVQRVFAMAFLTPVAEAPADMRGVLDVHGKIVPVIDPAARLGVTSRPPRPDDLIVLLELGGATVGLKVNQVIGLEQGEVLPPSRETRSPPYVVGHMRSGGGLVTVLDPSKLFGDGLQATVSAAAHATGQTHG